MKYIDADKLKAEIERRRDKCADIAADERNEKVAEYYHGKETAHDEIYFLITSLQQEQPEVDLEKEIKRFLSNATKMNKGEWRGKYPISDIGFRAVARHFYGLGLNARKEE